MDAVLLILVLAAGDADSVKAAQAVADALHAQHAQAQVVLAPEAAKQLAARGIADADLVRHADKPLAVTAKESRLVIVRVERRDAVTDRVIDVEVWAAGHRDGTTAVAKATGDPTSAAIEGACRLVREALVDPAAAAERADLALIAPFAERGDWAGLVAMAGRRENPSPRLRHAVVMAHLRLGDRAAAAEALKTLRTQAPDSPLTREAGAALDADPGGAGPLRDASPADDGSNVLH
jgi:hypothetical protein